MLWKTKKWQRCGPVIRLARKPLLIPVAIIPRIHTHGKYIMIHTHDA